MSIAQATAAASELDLGGTMFRMRPMSFIEIGEFERWAQEEFLRRIERSIAFLDDAAKNEERSKASALMRRLTLAASDDAAIKAMNEICNSTEGMVRLIWLSLRREHPQLSLEDCGYKLADKLALDRALEKWGDLNRGDEGKAAARTRARKSA